MARTKQKKVLIISRYFAPQSVMGAIRPTKIAKYLALEHNCQVIAAFAKGPYTVEDPLLEKDREWLTDTIEIEDAPWARFLLRFSSRRGTNKKIRNSPTTQWNTPTSPTTLIHTIKWNILIFLEWAKEMAFAIRTLRGIKRKGFSFDAIFSSYGPLGAHYSAIMLKKKTPELHWVADFRDPPAVIGNVPALLSVRSKRLSRDVFRYAQAITITTNGIAQDMKWPDDDKIHIIPNGYDSDDIARILPCKEDERRFNIVYTGVFYGDKRSFRLLFQALRELIYEDKIDEKSIILNYAGPDFSVLYNDAARFDLEGILCDFGLVSRKEALALQCSSRLLLLSSWSQQKDMQDIIPGKLYEYMMTSRPVVAVVNGDVAGTTLKEYIHRGNIGVCCEEAAGLEDFRYMKEYLMKQYDLYKQEKPVEYEPDEQYLEQFQYSGIAARVMELL